MRVLLASGGNYSIHRDDDIVDVRVWRRPELSVADGARFAQEKVMLLRRMAADPGVTSLVLDLSNAPTVVGPNTQQSIVAMCAGFVARALPIVFVVGTSATQRLQLERLARTIEPKLVSLVASSEEAFALLRS